MSIRQHHLAQLLKLSGHAALSESGEQQNTTHTIIQQIREELIPMMRKEIEDTVERTLIKLLPTISEHIRSTNTIVDTRAPCETCKREGKSESLYEATHLQESNFYSQYENNLYDTTSHYNYVRTRSRSEDIIATENKDLVPTLAHIDTGSSDCVFGSSETFEDTYRKRPYPRIIKYGSDMHLQSYNSIPTKMGEIDTFERSKTLPTGLTSPNAAPSYKRLQRRQKKGNGPNPSVPDERECLAKALQRNVEAIVDGVIFDESELQEMLVADGCLTEDERDTFMKLSDRKDQIRTILVLIKGRDLRVLKQFLNHLKNHNEHVYDDILTSFENNLKDGMRSKRCAMCTLFTDVNVKYVIDGLWSAEIVDDGLYNHARSTDSPSGAQEFIWQRIVDTINYHSQLQRNTVLKVLKQSLTKKNHYGHISKALEMDLNRYGQLKCRCNVRHQTIQGSYPASRASSDTPYTPLTASFDDLQSNHSDLTCLEAYTANVPEQEDTNEDEAEQTTITNLPIQERQLERQLDNNNAELQDMQELTEIPPTVMLDKRPPEPAKRKPSTPDNIQDDNDRVTYV